MSTCGWSEGLCTVSPPVTTEALTPRRGVRASGRAAPPGVRLRSQRQRMDMISPATIAPKPMAKFHADSETMKGIRSPAT
jgi:hypothetical protein